jgi:5'-nucleotidase / UDP-sugar diphosphatase
MRLTCTFPVLLTVLLLGSFVASSVSCQTSSVQPGEDDLRTVKIYHTNDIHSHLGPNAEGRGGLAYLASVLRIVREQDSNALILDAGDMYKKGSLPAQNSNDEVTADAVSLMPYYDARAIGNNEMKVGIAKLLDWAKHKEKAPLLSANFVDKDKKTVFKPYIILNKVGLKIGVIGLMPLVPIEANVQADPKEDAHAPYGVLDPLTAALPYIQELRPQVDVLILLAHNHYTENVKFAKDHPEVDLVVSGHSHVLTGDQKKMGGNMVVEAGQFGQQIGVVSLVYDKTKKKVASLDSTFWPVGEDLQLADGPIAEVVRQGYAKWAPDAYNRLGQAQESMFVIDLFHKYEGTFHDWVADRFCEATHCDVALVNREMLRETMYKGWINKEAVFLSAPYDDRIAVVIVSQKKLNNMLKGIVERSLKKTGLFPFSFHGITAQLRLENHNFKSVNLNFAPTKEDLVVVLPAYITNHCADFFTADECPLNQAQVGEGIRPLIEEAVIRQKIIKAPEATRIAVQDNDTTLAPVTPSTTEEDTDVPDDL